MDIPAITAFYDGNCPLCRREINHYSRLDRRRRIRWVDINSDQDLLPALDLTYNQTMRRFHVLDKDIRMQQGVDAFMALWAELPFYRAIVPFLRIFPTVPALAFAYEKFAAWRYRKQMQCVTCEPAVTRNEQRSQECAI